MRVGRRIVTATAPGLACSRASGDKNGVRAWTTSAAAVGRRSGSRSNMRATSSSSSGGTFGLEIVRTCRGASCCSWCRTAPTLLQKVYARPVGSQNMVVRPDVRLPTDRRRIVALFGRHELDAAQQRPRVGQPAGELPGQTEIDDLDLTVLGQQEVGRLQVAVDQVPVVGAP